MLILLALCYVYFNRYIHLFTVVAFQIECLTESDGDGVTWDA